MAVTQVGEYKNLWAVFRYVSEERNCAAKFEFIRLKTQPYGSVVFRRIYWEEGFHAFYTGFSPAMCGVMVYAGTSFFTYESLKFYLSEYQKSQVPAAILSTVIQGNPLNGWFAG